jgi:hypothetical protein
MVTNDWKLSSLNVDILLVMTVDCDWLTLSRLHIFTFSLCVYLHLQL